MKYLVTGGAGFIGSHIVDELLKQDNEVTIVDNLFSGKLKNIDAKKVKFVNADIRDFEILKKECKGADFILHQAARRSVPASFEEPEEYHDVNINGTRNVLEAARLNDVKRVVFASSSSVYGNVDQFPQKESFDPDPISPYALTKLAGEKYLNLYYKIYGLKTFSLRYFNVFGPRQDPNSKYAVVIPIFIHHVLNNTQPTIDGDGLQSKDFSFVKNVVEANLLACSAKKGFGEAFNIANGEGMSVNDLLKNINKICSKSIKPLYGPPRIGDVRKSWADVAKAKEYLGYEPKVDLVQGLKRTIEWFKEHPNW